MNTLLLAGLAGATAVAAAPAQAHPNWHYTGGCRSFTISDGTDSPQTGWNGEIQVSAVATDAAAPTPTASISVHCELRINGAAPGTIVFSCSTPGIGSVGCAGQFSYNADPDDVVTMCDLVTVNGEFHKDCGDTTAIPIAPEPVPEPVQELFDDLFRTVDDEICDYLASFAGTYGPLVIGPDGDVYLDGRRLHDCPPYDVDGDVFIPGETLGSITLFSTGGEPQVVLQGAFALPGWECTDPEVAGGQLGVRCVWQRLVGTSRPACAWASALAVLVPPFEVGNAGARTTTMCEGLELPEWVQTDVSTGGLEFAHRDLDRQRVSVVYCSVEDGDSGVPTRFFAECNVRFVS